MDAKKILIPLVSLVLFLSSACTKVMVYGTDHATNPVTQSYKLDPSQIYHQTVRVLDKMGYEIVTSDEYQYQIVTGWKPVTSGSHYLELFGRRDYAAAEGAYYQLMIHVLPEGNFGKAEIRTNVKTIAGKLTSSKRLEKDFIERLSDAVRSPQIEMTNVGVENK